MINITVGVYSLMNLAQFNILFGKNGSGKSTLLRMLDSQLRNDDTYNNILYVSPERGGNLLYEASIEQAMLNDNNWTPNQRRCNLSQNFRQQTISRFKSFELEFYRIKEREGNTGKFDDYIRMINDLLEYIKIERNGSSIEFLDKETNQPIQSTSISSGESEIISLAIEILIFSQQCIKTKASFLLLDEPSSHLHADSQAKFSRFLYDLLKDKNVFVVITTHDSAILGSLSEYKNVHIEFMRKGIKEINFKEISQEYKKILPVFGAHPLSNIFNQSPPFLVEGDDEERIWQQAIRTSNGKLRLYPCSTNGIAGMVEYEDIVNKIFASVYDNPTAYSLRDRDGKEENIPDNKFIIRFRLSCNTSENLLLSDEVLDILNINWDELVSKINAWLENVNNKNHSHYNDILDFKNKGYKRKSHNIKKIRNDILHLVGSPLNWEVAIGKTIGRLLSENISKNTGNTENSIFNYLGDKLVNTLFMK